jgi:Uma2 family endonuclease
MKQANIRFNYHDYLQLPGDKRYEILDGELYVVPSPNTRHQRVLKKILSALIRQTEDKDLGECFAAPYDVILSEENVVQPDILFVCRERLEIIREANLSGAPDLAIEILSTGSRQQDLAIKRKIYARFGIREYWIVDPEAAVVEVLTWTESGYINAGTFRESDRLTSPILPQLDLPLSEIFS